MLCVTGEGAKKLLQGQLTCDVNALQPEENTLAAHCNPQGRIISLFRLYFTNYNYYLSMPTELISIAKNALQKYAPFYKVTLSEATPNHIIEPSPLDTIYAGIPAIYPATSEKFLPHEINLHKLNAISFTKGCYTGQEIIARMQYRGKLKKHMYLTRCQADIQPVLNQDIYNEKDACGTLVDFVAEELNNYLILVIAPIESSSLFLDIDRNYKLTMLPLPYSL